MQDKAASEAKAAAKSAEFRAVAAANRLAVTTAATAVVESIRAAVLLRMFHHRSPAAAAAAAATAQHDESTVRMDRVSIGPIQAEDVNSAAAVNVISHQVATAKVAEVAVVSSFAAAHSGDVSSTKHAASVAAVPVGDSTSEADYLHNVLSRLNLLQLEVNKLFMRSIRGAL